MLPSTSYFKTFYCPFYQNGFCQRPYCHYRDEKRPPSISVEEEASPFHPIRKRSIDADQPPEEKPSYCPTPLAVLAQVTQPPRLSSSYVPTKITRLAISAPPVKRKKSPEVASSENVLGDIEDLSDGDNTPSGSDGPDLLSSILLDGKKSGVMNNVDEFELDVLRNKIKLKIEKEKKKLAHQDSPESTKISMTPVVNDHPVPDDSSEEAADRAKSKDERLMESRSKILQEIEILEQKRKLLEEYYRSRNMIGGSKTDNDRDDRRDHSSSDERRRHKHKKKERDRHRHKEKKSDRDEREREDRHKRKDRKEERKSSDKERKSHHKDRDRDRKHSKDSRSDKKRDTETEKKVTRENESPPSDEDVLSFLELMTEIDKKNSRDFKTPEESKKSEKVHKDSKRGSTSKSTDLVKEFHRSECLSNSPIPDVSPQLSLPSGDSGHPGSDDDGLSGSDVDETEQLRRIYDEFDASVPSSSLGDDSALRKAKKLEQEKQNAELHDLEVTTSKKRTAHVGAFQELRKFERRPTSNPSKVMFERFRKTQQSHLESDLASVMEGKSPVAQTTAGQTTTLIQGSSKVKNRVAHAPSTSTQSALARQPMIEPDSQCKVPTTIRQRYLTSIVEECKKIYHGNRDKASERALSEEKLCYSKSKNRAIYLNVVVNCIKKLRAEAAKAAKNPPPSSNSSNQDLKAHNLVTTHLQVLAGKPGSIGTWSIEKKSSNHLDYNNFSEEVFYTFLSRYILSEDELEANGYPVPDPGVRGGALISPKAHFRNIGTQLADPFKRKCDRCTKIYEIDESGHQVSLDDPCIYHWGRNHTTRGNRATGHVSMYTCCNGDAQSDGCQVHPYHVSDVLELRGFVATKDPDEEAKTHKVYALDCEMCSTTMGSELTRVTVIGYDGKTVYESVVKPDNDIIDYNTRFSGITADDLAGVTTSIRDVQAILLSMFTTKTILIGHSLESDLKALRIFHHNIVDTSVVFPHKLGPPFKRALRNLASDHLKRIIQNDVGGHDSAEDALTCMDLMKMKVREDIKKLVQMQKKKNNS